ncbi:YkvA family protein [Anaeromicropila herbilytica]|uniref:DUF1232 domain-containing protein n=1 Tax=Anaeromicropila herbilytica TaxID=2785025 RepID=A0A7R7ICM3_9FIRM|nr:YkvA family protein [Anaeromicropila herbilytica]BCN29138.1 hypothetical protein bsdtb5_04330 [Anaeromicropila herbilytica]
MNIKEKAKEIKKDIVTLFIAFKKKETPWYAKIIVAITVIYALSPIDLIPDFIPVLGYLDDVIILPLFIILAIKLIPKNIIEESREEAKDQWRDGKPVKWYYGIPFVVIWVFIIWEVYSIFFQ